jgi:hypothetical protein
LSNIFETYETTILPVVLYVCETWSLTLREEYRLRVFENSRKISGPKRDEVRLEKKCILRNSIACNLCQILLA